MKTHHPIQASDALMQNSANNRKKVGLVLILAVIALSIGAVLMLRSPSYALYKISKAVQEKDLATFYSHLDLNRIVDSTIDAVATDQMAKTADSKWDAVAANLGAGVAKLLKPQIMQLVKREIESRFYQHPPAEASTDNKESPLGDLSEVKNLFRETVDYKLGSVARSGERALVNFEVKVPALDKSYAFLLVMEYDDNWKIVGFEGLSAALSAYAHDKGEKLARFNAKLQTDLRISLPLETSVAVHSKLLGLQKNLAMTFMLTNKLKPPQTIHAIDARLILSNSQGAEIRSLPFSAKDLILKPDQIQSFETTLNLMPWNDEDQRVLKAGELSLKVIFLAVHLENADIIRAASRYEEIRSQSSQAD